MGEDRIDLTAYARGMLDENRYVVLGTADGDGVPWVSPVFYALDGYSRVLWLSDPETRHSRNVAVQPRVSLVVFDSTVPIGGAKAVYMTGTVAIDEDALDAYNRGCLAKGASAFTTEKVGEGRPFRLYSATIAEHWVLDPTLPRDARTAVSP
ncbi:pyridoxamine 5'-phosphate oxidase family protein [Dactylosporangium sp. CS-033363]|uniref:pyridoxamine 5'-phosphate oxidase family protein n=1 Tax=Dactylosporangium sp. CS-033363 TaxID=3239935 RepID=UPI003D8CC59C